MLSRSPPGHGGRQGCGCCPTRAGRAGPEAEEGIAESPDGRTPEGRLSAKERPVLPLQAVQTTRDPPRYQVVPGRVPFLLRARPGLSRSPVPPGTGDRLATGFPAGKAGCPRSPCRCRSPPRCRLGPPCACRASTCTTPGRGSC